MRHSFKSQRPCTMPTWGRHSPSRPLATMWKMQCDINIVIINFHKQFRLLATRKYFGAFVSAFASGIGLYIRLPGPGPGRGRGPCRGQGAGTTTFIIINCAQIYAASGQPDPKRDTVRTVSYLCRLSHRET